MTADAGPAAPEVRSAQAETRAPWIRIAKFGALFGLGAAGVATALTSTETPFVYSMDVDAVTTNPGAVLGRTLRVEGELRPGSIAFREEPCEYRFVIEKNGQQLPVRFPECIVPDTFRDGMGITVVVEGQLESNTSFLATEVIPRCPSRYEMDERQRNGEAVPHGPTSWAVAPCLARSRW